MANNTINCRSIYDSFGYEQVNGEWCYGKYEYNSTTKATEFVRYGRYIAIQEVDVDLDGGSPVLSIYYDTLDGLSNCVKVKKELLGKKRELQDVLLKSDADALDTSLTVLMYCLHVSEEQAARGYCYRRTGWLIKALEGSKILSFKGPYLVSDEPDDAQTKYVGKYDLTTKGTYEGWHKMLVNHVMGHVALEIAVLISLSAIISSEWGARNLVFHFMGDSSTGKTSSAILAVSALGCPEPKQSLAHMGADGKPLRTLLSSWKGTANAWTAKLDGLDGTLMVFDELSKVDDAKGLASAIYTFSDGADKDRMYGPDDLLTTNVIRTNILSIGEESLLQKTTNQNSGLNVRVCEISTDFTESSQHAESIVASCKEHYGHAAPRFVKHLIDNYTYEDIAALRNESLDCYEQALVSAGYAEKNVRRLAEFGAILLTVAEIADGAFGVQFSREKIIDFLVDQQMSSGANVDIGTRAHMALRGFVNTHIANFITDDSDIWGKSIPCYGKIEKHKGTGVTTVSVPVSEFPKIMEQLHFNNSDLVIKRMKENDMLLYEKGKTYRKRIITKAAGVVRVYVIKLP